MVENGEPQFREIFFQHNTIIVVIIILFACMSVQYVSGGFEQRIGGHGPPLWPKHSLQCVQAMAKAFHIKNDPHKELIVEIR